MFDVQQYHVIPENWCSDDWETPPQVAKFIASLVGADEKVICEPAAGRGAIAQHLPNGTICIEKNPIRHMAGAVPHQDWICDDFIGWAEDHLTGIEEAGFKPLDLVVGNPPFSMAIEFLNASLSLLSKTGRILFLLPTDFFQAQERSLRFLKGDLVISHAWEISGRVGYIQEGIVRNERQCSDSVFEFRRKGTCTPAIEIVDPYGKLRGAA